MPQPIKTPGGMLNSAPSKLVEMQPQMIASIGTICLAWSHLEQSLAFLLTTSLGSAVQQGGSKWDIDSNWVAQVAMDAADSIRGRIKLIDRTLGVKLQGSPYKSTWKVLSERLTKRASERNLIVHTAWLYTENKPNGLIQVTPSGEYIFWTSQDFIDAKDRIEALRVEVYQYALLLIAYFNKSIK